MIFPELPKKHAWQQSVVTSTVETPLRESTEPTGSSRITVEEWWIKHGLATDPAASSTRSRENLTIDWFSKDAVEFYALCVAMIAWCVYWRGVHIGAW